MELTRVLSVGLFSLCAMAANAATITLTGTSVTYEYDDAANAGALALFGTPTIIGNDVRFLPPDFRAESIDGIGASSGTNSDIVSANFIFSRVYSQNGNDLMQIKVVEFVDYEITTGDSASVDLLLTAASNSSVFDLVSDDVSFDASGDSSGLQTTTMMVLVDPSNAFSGSASDIAVSIQNTLKATTDASGETAWIQKKLSFTAVTEVPVPAAAWLFGSALIGLAGIKKRKK